MVRLDDFHREFDDPRLPRSDLGIADWDHPDSWNTEAALEALSTLSTTVTANVPVYRQNRYLTALRRLLRDHAERRKPPQILLRRGLSLLRREPGSVAAAAALGACPITPYRAAEREPAPLLTAAR